MKRSLYYTSKAYVEQLPKGEDYSKLKKVYFIGILNFTIFENREFISRHLIINQETKSQDLDDFEFTFVELPKFTKGLDELNSTLDKWIYFLKNADDLEMIPQTYENIIEFTDAFHLASQCNWNKKEIEVYDYMKLKAFDEINAIRTAEKKAEKRGMEKGLEKGIEKGIAKGIEKEKISIAQNLLDILDDETIALKTGLDVYKIANLRK